MKAEGRAPGQILSPNPIFANKAVADYVGAALRRAAQARSAIQTVLPTEQDSLQAKGARKDLVIS